MASIVRDIFVLILAGYLILLFWKIVKKTGDNPIASLLILIPLVNIVYLSIMAFSEWPIEKDLRIYKEKHRRNKRENDEIIYNIPETCPQCNNLIPKGNKKCNTCNWPYDGEYQL